MRGLKSVTHGQTNRRMVKPKAICPSNLVGIKSTFISLINCDLLEDWLTPLNTKQIWTEAQYFLQYSMYAQRRLRSACASEQSDQSLRCPPQGALDPWLRSLCHAKSLIRLHGCAGWSELRCVHMPSKYSTSIYSGPLSARQGSWQPITARCRFLKNVSWV